MSKPKLGVLGGTGNVGKEFVDEALKKGYKIIALVRNPAKVTPVEGLEVVKGDATVARDVADLVEKSDVVVSMVGPVKGGGAIVSTTAQNILAANPKRFIFITTLGANGSSCVAGCLLKRCIYFGKKGKENNGFVDHEEADTLLQGASCDWTIVRPTYMEGTPSRGRCSATTSTGASCCWMCKPISKLDVAHFMVDEVENMHYNKTCVHLHNGNSHVYSVAANNPSKVVPDKEEAPDKQEAQLIGKS